MSAEPHQQHFEEPAGPDGSKTLMTLCLAICDDLCWIKRIVSTQCTADIDSYAHTHACWIGEGAQNRHSESMWGWHH